MREWTAEKRKSLLFTRVKINGFQPSFQAEISARYDQGLSIKLTLNDYMA